MRWLKPLLLLLGAATVGVVAGLVLLTRDGGEDALDPVDAAALQGRPIAIRPSVEPTTHVFGDRVVAEAEVVADARQIVPESVRVEANFDPYTRVGEVERIEARSGDLVRVVHRFQLACFAPSCVPSGDRSEVDLQSARVFFQQRQLDGRPVRTQQTILWPTVSVASRLGPFDVERARWRAETSTMPGVSYRISPGALGAVLLLGAALLLGTAGVLLTTIGPVRLRRARVEVEEAPALSPLERALELAQATSRNGAAGDQRRALERLSRELLVVGEPTLAGRARRLAWSSGRAQSDEVEQLAGDIRAARSEKEPTT